MHLTSEKVKWLFTYFAFISLGWWGNQPLCRLGEMNIARLPQAGPAVRFVCRAFNPSTILYTMNMRCHSRRAYLMGACQTLRVYANPQVYGRARTCTHSATVYQFTVCIAVLWCASILA